MNDIQVGSHLNPTFPLIVHFGFSSANFEVKIHTLEKAK
jgi:hypothetical protein